MLDAVSAALTTQELLELKRRIKATTRRRRPRWPRSGWPSTSSSPRSERERGGLGPAPGVSRIFGLRGTGASMPIAHVNGADVHYTDTGAPPGKPDAADGGVRSWAPVQRLDVLPSGRGAEGRVPVRHHRLAQPGRVAGGPRRSRHGHPHARPRRPPRRARARRGALRGALDGRATSACGSPRGTRIVSGRSSCSTPMPEPRTPRSGEVPAAREHLPVRRPGSDPQADHSDHVRPHLSRGSTWAGRDRGMARPS